MSLECAGYSSQLSNAKMLRSICIPTSSSYFLSVFMLDTVIFSHSFADVVVWKWHLLDGFVFHISTSTQEIKPNFYCLLVMHISSSEKYAFKLGCFSHWFIVILYTLEIAAQFLKYIYVIRRFVILEYCYFVSSGCNYFSHCFLSEHTDFESGVSWAWKLRKE